MNNLEVQLEAPILPDVGLGGLRLRARLAEIQDLVAGLGLSKEGSYRLAGPFEARYCLGGGEVEIAVDVRNGKVFKLVASQGYEGRLFNVISIGMLAEEAMALVPELYYNEAEEVILHRTQTGVALEVSGDDPPADQVPGMPIEAISVFVRELNTPAGQKGEW